MDEEIGREEEDVEVDGMDGRFEDDADAEAFAASVRLRARFIRCDSALSLPNDPLPCLITDCQ